MINNKNNNLIEKSVLYRIINNLVDNNRLAY